MKKPVPKRKGYAEGGVVMSSDSTPVYVPRDATTSQAFRQGPVDLTPPRRVADAGKAKGGKVKKVIKRR